ncbi:MAG: hypothetical protein BGO88_07655 [Flavobacterium sp. 38-13]|jgi:hypothetical protein|uniref:hypothetical protein n=1 Tax=Flavobacterium TaxID=237 RepID=UPI000967AD0D|nr:MULTISPECIES: hypothetical protein [Flavobacterium]OJX51058.1 MAG: hypothetical protein BGO88_07655 [Flavobacterium sp. 38-13]
MSFVKSYDILNKIRKSIDTSLDDSIILAELEKQEKTIRDVISEDFQQLFNIKLNFINSVIYYDDGSYRQGATAIFLKANILNEQDFLITFEFLIDFNKILVGVKGESVNSHLQTVCNKIEKAYNSENKAELKEI